MVEILPASDPRVRIELVFHPPAGDALVVSLPREDYLDELTVRAVYAELHKLNRTAERERNEIPRTYRRFQVEQAKYQKAFDVWLRKLNDPDVDDPGPEPEEPEQPEFPAPPTDIENSRTAALAAFKVLLAADEYEVIEQCTTAEVTQAFTAWGKHSAIPLGEFLASLTSSTENTERPSSLTSSTEDGTDTTSDTDSPGTN